MNSKIISILVGIILIATIIPMIPTVKADTTTTTTYRPSGDELPDAANCYVYNEALEAPADNYPDPVNLYQSVDEVTSDGGATTLTWNHNQIDSSQRVLFDMSGGTAGNSSTVINNVTLHAVIRHSGPASLTTLYKWLLENTSIWESSEYTYSTNTYSEVTYVMTTNPITSSAWTWGEIPFLHAGIYQTSGNRDLIVTQYWMNITYTYAPPAPNPLKTIWDGTPYPTIWDNGYLNASSPGGYPIGCGYWGANQTAADDFNLATGTYINNVTFTGFASGADMDVTILFYANLNGLPGAVLKTRNVRATDAAYLGTYGYDSYMYNVSIPPTYLPAGTHWISIVRTDDPSAWDFWMDSYLHTQNWLAENDGHGAGWYNISYPMDLSFKLGGYAGSPPTNSPPSFGTPNPVNGSTGQLHSLTWGIPISDPDGDGINWTIECSNGQTTASPQAQGSGTKSLSLSGLSPLTTYTIWVNATDGSLWTREWFTFQTISDTSPIFGTPSPTNGSTGQSLDFTWQIGINDDELDNISWTLQCNGQSNSSAGLSGLTASISLSGLSPFTNYMIWVNATDSSLWTREWFTFQTGAPVVWDNGGGVTYAADPAYGEYSSILIFGSINNVQAADDFILSENTTIASVNWQGITFDGNPSENFNIHFYADDGTGNAPTGAGLSNPETTALANYTVTATESPTGSYTATLSPGFTATGSIKYWIAIQYNEPSSLGWLWLRETTYAPRLHEGQWGAPDAGVPYWYEDQQYPPGDYAFKLYGGTGGGNETPPLTGAPTQNMNITLTPGGTAEIIVNPTTWGASSAIGESISTAPNAFALENNGTIQVDVTVNASNTSAWTLGSSPAYNQFQMQYGTGSGGGTIPASVIIPAMENASSSDEIHYVKVAAFNSTRFIVSWLNGTDANIYVRIGDYISGGISWVTAPYDITDGYTVIDALYSVAILDATHFVIVYDDQIAYYGVTAKIGNISTGAIVMSDPYDTGIGSLYNYGISPDTFINTVAFDANYFLMYYVDGGNNQYNLMCGYYDGTDITFGTALNLFTVVAGSHAMTTIDSTHFLVNYVISGLTRVRAGLRSGTTLTFLPTQITFCPHSTDASALTMINSTYFAFAYGNTSSVKGELLIGRYNGPSTLLSIMTPVSVFSNYQTTQISMDMLDATHFAMEYLNNESTGPFEQWVKVGEYSGGVVTWLAQEKLVQHAPWGVSNTGLYRLNDTTFVFINDDNPNTFIGTFVPEHSGGTGITWTNLGLTPASFISNLSYDASQDFGLKLFMPTSSSTITNQTLMITFTATVD